MTMVSFSIHDGTISVGTERRCAPSSPRRRAWGPQHYAGDWETFNRLLQVLRQSGFVVGGDPRIDERYPSLSRSHRRAAASTPQGVLYVAAEIFPVGCRLEFFQDVVTVNPNGGRYDFDRVAKMPYLIRKKFEAVVARVSAHLEARRFACRTKIGTAVQIETIGRRLLVSEGRARVATASSISWAALLHFNETWDTESDRRALRHRFERGPDGWPALPDGYGCWRLHDADGVRILSGQVRYMRDRKGYLRKGRVYGGINGMWTMVYGPGRRDCTHAASHELFSEVGGRPRKEHPRPTPLTKLLEQAVAARDYERAIVIRNLLDARPRPAVAA